MRSPLILLVVSFLLSSGQQALSQAPHYSKQLDAETIQEKRRLYKKRLNQLEKFRQSQLQKYRKSSHEKKLSLIHQTRHELQMALINDLFPAWDGTPWDFNGTSATPEKGKIACGYFVSTCLNHLGYQVNRYRLAQQPSQRIIETFMSKADRDILAGGKPLSTIKKYLKSQGDGIYIVGLDCHVGFVSVQGDHFSFIHSTSYPPHRSVICERLDSHNPLKHSQYRVFGKLFSDQMIINWLYKKHYPVKTH